MRRVEILGGMVGSPGCVQAKSGISFHVGRLHVRGFGAKHLQVNIRRLDGIGVFRAETYGLGERGGRKLESSSSILKHLDTVSQELSSSRKAHALTKARL